MKNDNGFVIEANCIEEQELLLACLKPHMRVLEYGSGISTHAIAPLVKELVSIEHHKGWFDKVSENLPSNVNLYFVPPNAEPKPDYDDGTYEDFKDYVEYPLPLAENNKFDVIFIDGRARVACASICPKLGHKETIVFIHDYNHPDPQYVRKEYFEAEKYLTRLSGVFAMWKFKLKYYFLV